MAIINEEVTATVTSDLEPQLTNKQLKGFIYKDSTWLESARRTCIAFIADYSSIIKNRTPYEALATYVVNAGYTFYLGFNFNQHNSDKCSVALVNSSNTTYIKQTAMNDLAVRAHLDCINTNLVDNLPLTKDIILVSNYTGGLGLLEWSRNSISYGQDSLVKNIVTLGLSAGFNNGLVNDYINNSFIVQKLYSCKHPLLSLFSNDDERANANYAKRLRYQLATKEDIIFAGVGEVGNNWTLTGDFSWVDMAISHNTNPDEIEVGGVTYLPGI